MASVEFARLVYTMNQLQRRKHYTGFLFYLPRLNSRRKLHQQSPIQSIIAAIRRKIHRLYTINRHRMYQNLHISIPSRIVRYYGTLISIRARNRIDRRDVVVICQCVLVLDHGVAVAEEPRWREAAGVENDRGDG